MCVESIQRASVVTVRQHCAAGLTPLCCDTSGTVVTTGLETSLDLQMTAASTMGGHTYGIHSGYWSTNDGSIIGDTHGLPITWMLQIAVRLQLQDHCEPLLTY